MGSLISALAFPAPKYPKDFYRRVLESRQDFVYLTTANNEKIPAVFIRNNASKAGNRPTLTIIYSHGNAEDIGLHLPLMDALSRCTGCNILSYEYVGYSLSLLEGDAPSEEGCLRSIDAAWRYATETLNIPPNQIVLFGRSIGTGPTVDLASREYLTGCDIFTSSVQFKVSPLEIAGVILQSPIASGARALMGTTASLIGYPLDIFRNYTKIQKIKAPVAIMHGLDDEVVPLDNGQQLYQLLQQPFDPYWMAGKGHNDMPDALVFSYTKNFVDSLLKTMF